MMLDASDDLADKAMAPCMGTVQLQMIGGHRGSGERFGTMITDGMAGGMGARAFTDGADSAGMINAPAAAISNVESNEHNFPVRYLWRRQRPDTGGPGQHRGGVGAELAYVFEDIAGSVESTFVSTGVEQSTSGGLRGGDPGAPNAFWVLRGASAAGPDGDVGGERVTSPPKASMPIDAGEVVVNIFTGGGGIGDPLDREPAEVAVDVEDGTVSVEAAEADYGVVVSLDESERAVVDEVATDARRRDLRRHRLGGREPLPALESPPAGRRVSSSLVLAKGRFACRRCGTDLGPSDCNVKDALLLEEVPVPRRWPTAAEQPGSSRFVLRRFHCPGCALRVDAELNLADRPPIWNLDPR